jgi:SAM-dependent methyltransferase
MNKSAEQTYGFQRYDHKSRWISYWHQINEVLSLNPRNVLEVGAGNKTVANYLKNKNIEVTTMDIDGGIGPDVVASVLKMPFADNSFDVVLCAEVLEHLPFENLAKGLEELKRVTRKNVVLSLPHFGCSLKLNFKIPLLRERTVAFRFPFPRRHRFNGEHYWEVGKRGYAVGKVRKMVANYFKIKKEFIPFENQYHRFFILEKTNEK